MGFPFFNKYPYTNFEQLNLDKLMELVGSFDQRLLEAEASIADHTIRIETLENDLTALTERVTADEADIDALEGRMDTAEGNINSLTNRVTAAEGDIIALNSDIDRIDDKDSAQDEEIDRLKDKVSDIEDDIMDLSGLAAQVQRNTNDITGIDSRTEVLEAHKVTANPGGTPTMTLNTVTIGDTDYKIQGSGTGGSSVTPNPSGEATAILDKIDIDGTVFDIPSGVDTSDMIADQFSELLEYNKGDIIIYNNTLYECLEDGTTGPFNINDWMATTIAEVASKAENTAERIESLYENLGTTIVKDTASTINTGTNKIVIPAVALDLTPGAWLVNINVSFDTRKLGSKQRGLYVYLDDENGENIAQNSKYMWGTEAITSINTANSVSFSAIVDVPADTEHYRTNIALKVPTNTGSGTVDAYCRVAATIVKPK